MATVQSILVIDDDEDLGELIHSVALVYDVRCTVTTDVEIFLEKLTPEITLVMVDLVMPRIDGVQLLRRLAERKHPARVVLMSGLGKRVIETAEQFGRAAGLNVMGYLKKPFKVQELQDLFARTLKQIPSNRLEAITPVDLTDVELQRAIEHDEFVNFYQPQIDLKTRKVAGLEALVRWSSPRHGTVLPELFVSRLEALGLIDDLGWLVIERALSEIGMLVDEAGVMPAISINVSAFSLHDVTFPDRLESIARSFNVPAGRVTLEITESGFMRDLPNTLDVLARLRLKEFELSIDDFGTGYSMMQQLRTVPATELKIDKSFVQGSSRGGSDSIMVLKTIEIGHELNMRVIAEGIETEEQLDFVARQGCDLGQGHLFCKPLSPPDLVEWLADRRSAN